MSRRYNHHIYQPERARVLELLAMSHDALVAIIIRRPVSTVQRIRSEAGLKRNTYRLNTRTITNPEE